LRESEKPHFAQNTGISRVVLVAIIIILIAIGAVAGLYYLDYPKSTKPTLILYSADAYVGESSALESAFTRSSGIQMAPPKSAGSLVLAQEIAQGNPVSVFLSVSKSAVGPSYLQSESSGWAISFATDQMTIAYSNATQRSSAGAQVVREYQTLLASNSTYNWAVLFSSLTSGQVKVGLSNPNSDPAGYRGWLVLEAAGMEFANGSSSYFSSRMLQNAGNVTAASAADLVSPLESGQIQFLFIYKSAAISQHLGFFQLPSGINFGDPADASYYGQFTYTISSGIQEGAPIAIFITVPKDSTDPSDSMSFVIFVVENARTVLASFGLTFITPAKLYNDSAVPTQIQQLVAQGNLELAGTL
jgi:molybdate/tungstate transport system substrate-binding protein